MSNKIDASEALRDLTPQTQYGEFEKCWPAIKEAIDRKITLLAIWQSLHDKGVLNVSYATFTRFIKRIEPDGEPIGKGNKGPGTTSLGKVDETKQLQETTDQKNPPRNPLSDAKGFVHGGTRDKKELF